MSASPDHGDIQVKALHQFLPDLYPELVAPLPEDPQQIQSIWRHKREVIDEILPLIIRFAETSTAAGRILSLAK